VPKAQRRTGRKVKARPRIKPERGASGKYKLADLDKFTSNELDKLTLADFDLEEGRAIPSSELTPEHRRSLEDLAKAEQLYRQQNEGIAFDHAAAGRVLDRAAAEARWGRPLPAKSKRKKRRPIGRPRDYDRDAIAGVTEDYIRDKGLPRTQALLREKVIDACCNHKPRTIEVPGEYLLKEITRPIYKRYKRLSAKGRKVGN
jgi:hypothetical protein